MPVSRTRFAEDIVTEFIAPKNVRSKKVLIFASGMPSVPKKNDLLKQYAELGYWVFFPRYRGTWESGGKFLAKSPHLDLLDVMNGISKGFKDFWTGETIKFKPSAFYLIGSSFGGSAVLLAAQDKRVTKVVALSPVCDWRVDSVVEPLDWLGNFIKDAFGEAFRFTQKDWKKLGTKTFFNPIDIASKVSGDKILLIHAKDDQLAAYEPTKLFAQLSGAKLMTLKSGGHLSGSRLLQARFKKKVNEFFS
jgi:dipeptidyl aminopeptidase/acylaminoacyl peptidase